MHQPDTEQDLRGDIEAVARIDIIPTILDVVCRSTRMRFAAVARVTDTRWIACSVRDEIAFGLVPGGELQLETTICNEIRQHGRVVVIDDVSQDPVFHHHHTPLRYGFKSYISVPITLPNGGFFGTLCAIDPAAAHLDNPETLGMFKAFAELIGLHLAAQKRLDASEADLRHERKDAELREQFIAVLGHDLRNPLSAIQFGTQMLQRAPTPEQAARVLTMMQDSVQRMSGLIDNVLDFARGRLGGGLALERLAEGDLPSLIHHVIAELQSAWPDRTITTRLDLPHTVRCDRARIGQLVSNLLSNALTHGAPDTPVTLTARLVGDSFELAVTNAGPPIPPPLLARLFEPFVRTAAKPGNHGLGLGLYIASEIARAHRGSLTVTSNADETRFTFTMPVR